MKRKKIYIAYTGGTIGMKQSSRGYVPVAGYLTDTVKNNAELLAMKCRFLIFMNIAR